MDREIKFKGKQLEYPHSWIYGQLITDEGGKAYILDQDDFHREIIHDVEPDNDLSFVIGLVEVDPNTVGQYTGLKDKNGKEVYEGDIVSSGATTGVVMYDCEQAGFVVQKEKTIELQFYSLLGIEVIGNIHDNPELIK